MGTDLKNVWKQLRDRESFCEILARIECKDSLKAVEIHTELHEVLEKTSQYYKSVNYNTTLSLLDLWATRVALLQEIINTKAHSTRYSQCVTQFSSKETELRRQSPVIVDEFFDCCLTGLDQYFEKQEHRLHCDIDSTVTWTTEPKDKIKGLVRGMADMGGTAAEQAGAKLSEFGNMWASRGKTLLKGIEEKAQSVCEKINPETTLQQIWKSHMSEEAKEVEKVLLAAWQQYEIQWQQLGAYESVCHDKEFCRYVAESNKNAKPNNTINPAMKVGEAGAFVGVAATISLAMGWHTLSYAVVHVFPPALIFSLVATAWTGKMQEAGYKNEIKSQFSRCIRLIRQDYVQIWFEGHDTEGRQAPLRTEIMRDASSRVAAALSVWQRQLFGNLDVDDYNGLINAVDSHLGLLEEGLVQLDERLGSLSRERNEYPQFLQMYRQRYLGLDEESLGMLATGEVLLRMHAEKEFYDCSPAALPFTKVLERELYRVFYDQFAQHVRQNQEKEMKFMLGTFLRKARLGEIIGEWEGDFLKKINMANLVRCSLAHRDPISYDRAIRIRELIVGQHDLLREIGLLGKRNNEKADKL